MKLSRAEERRRRQIRSLLEYGHRLLGCLPSNDSGYILARADVTGPLLYVGDEGPVVYTPEGELWAFGPTLQRIRRHIRLAGAYRRKLSVKLANYDGIALSEVKSETPCGTAHLRR